MVNKVDMIKVIPDDTKSINQMGIAPLGEVRDNLTFKQLRAVSKKYNFSFATPVKDIPKIALDTILYGGDNTFEVQMGYGGSEQSYNLAYEGLVKMLERWYENSSSEKIRRWAEDFMTIDTCPECNGARLKRESLCFRVNEKNISELSNMDLVELNDWMANVEEQLSDQPQAIAKDILKEIRFRLEFLLHVGLDYLTLDRPARTLSGGEAQRIRLATQIGSQLTGITYILDEPSIGLHQRDNQRLIEALRELTEIGNTVLVVEHDKDIMMASDYLIDLTGAGKHGGEVVGQGTPEAFIKRDTITADYLTNRRKIEVPSVRRPGNGLFLELTGATGNNLKNVDIAIPLGTLCCVTGVSGSGKSTLINETMYPILRQYFYNSLQKPMAHKTIKGLEHLDKVIEIDQSPIGRSAPFQPGYLHRRFYGYSKNFHRTARI